MYSEPILVDSPTFKPLKEENLIEELKRIFEINEVNELDDSAKTPKKSDEKKPASKPTSHIDWNSLRKMREENNR